VLVQEEIKRCQAIRMRDGGVQSDDFQQKEVLSGDREREEKILRAWLVSLM
jgi:hypothetical protein